MRHYQTLTQTPNRHDGKTVIILENEIIKCNHMFYWRTPPNML